MDEPAKAEPKKSFCLPCYGAGKMLVHRLISTSTLEMWVACHSCQPNGGQPVSGP